MKLRSGGVDSKGSEILGVTLHLVRSVPGQPKIERKCLDYVVQA